MLAVVAPDRVRLSHPVVVVLKVVTLVMEIMLIAQCRSYRTTMLTAWCRLAPNKTHLQTILSVNIWKNWRCTTQQQDKRAFVCFPVFAQHLLAICSDSWNGRCPNSWINCGKATQQKGKECNCQTSSLNKESSRSWGGALLRGWCFSLMQRSVLIWKAIQSLDGETDKASITA